jgi:hypothetical protein
LAIVDRTICTTLLHIVVVFFTTMLDGGGDHWPSGQNHLHHTAPHRGGVLHNHVRRGGVGDHWLVDRTIYLPLLRTMLFATNEVGGGEAIGQWTEVSSFAPDYRTKANLRIEQPPSLFSVPSPPMTMISGPFSGSLHNRD